MVLDGSRKRASFGLRVTGVVERSTRLGDAGARDSVLFDIHAERELDQDLELGARVEAAHVERRVGLGVAEIARLFQHLRQRAVAPRATVRAATVGAAAARAEREQVDNGGADHAHTAVSCALCAHHASCGARG